MLVIRQKNYFFIDLKTITYCVTIVFTDRCRSLLALIFVLDLNLYLITKKNVIFVAA
jgi:hypothetical protein